MHIGAQSIECLPTFNSSLKRSIRTFVEDVLRFLLEQAGFEVFTCGLYIITERAPELFFDPRNHQFFGRIRVLINIQAIFWPLFHPC